MWRRLHRLGRSFAWWLLANLHPAADEIDQALIDAFADCGLNTALYADDFNLRNTGKFHEVLIHASARLGNTLQTVADVKAMLE